MMMMKILIFSKEKRKGTNRKPQEKNLIMMIMIISLVMKIIKNLPEEKQDILVKL
jgi:hypothetical protein